MNRLIGTTCFLFILTALVFFGGRSKPDESKKIDGPGNGISYIIETTYGAGAATSDYTRIFASWKNGGAIEKVLVLSGENLDVKEVSWRDSSNVDICISGGITDHYSNQVMVGEVGRVVQVKNHLVETCEKAVSLSWMD